MLKMLVPLELLPVPNSVSVRGSPETQNQENIHIKRFISGTWLTRCGDVGDSRTADLKVVRRAGRPGRVG